MPDVGFVIEETRNNNITASFKKLLISFVSDAKKPFICYPNGEHRVPLSDVDVLCIGSDPPVFTQALYRPLVDQVQTKHVSV